LITPNCNKDWHIGIKAAGKEKLYGFITGTALKTSVQG